VDNNPPMKRSLIIDASPLLYKGFYVPVFKDMRSVNNIPVNAVYPFIKSVFGIHKANKNCDYIAVMFDSAKNTYRKDKFADYKGTRKRIDPNLIPQFQIAKTCLQYLGIRWIDEPNFEADDLLASYAHHLSQNSNEVTVVSTDKDLHQLVSDKIKVFDPAKKILVDREWILAKYGIEPAQIADLLSLTKLIEENLKNLEVSYELVKLRKDAKMTPLSDLEYKSFDPRLFDYLKDLKFFSIMQTLENMKSLKDMK
jgi:DNA polymerase-1